MGKYFLYFLFEAIGAIGVEQHMWWISVYMITLTGFYLCAINLNPLKVKFVKGGLQLIIYF